MVELGWGVLGVTCGVCLVYQVRAVAVAPQTEAAQTTDPPRSRGELTAADAARRPLAGLFRGRGDPEQVR